MHAEIAVIDWVEHGVYFYTWDTEEMMPSCDVHEETLKFLESKGHKRTHIKYIATDSGHLDIHDFREKGDRNGRALCDLWSCTRHRESDFRRQTLLP